MSGAAVRLLVRESAYGWQCEPASDPAAILAAMRRLGVLWAAVARDPELVYEGVISRNDMAEVARLAESAGAPAADLIRTRMHPVTARTGLAPHAVVVALEPAPDDAGVVHPAANEAPSAAEEAPAA